MVGKVVNINDDTVTIQVFGDSAGMSTENTRVRFSQRPFEIALSEDILGRKFTKKIIMIIY